MQKQHLVGTLLMSQSCSRCIWFYEFLDKGRFSLLLHQIESGCGKGGRRHWVRGKASTVLPFTPVVTVSLGAGVQQLFSVETQKVTGVSLAFSWGGKAHRPRELFSCRVIEDHAGRTRSLLWAGWGQLGKFQGEAGVELRPGCC